VLHLDGSGSLVDRSGAALAVLEGLPKTAITVVDRDLRYLLATGAVLTEAGYDPALLEGRVAPDVIPRERWIIYDPLVRTALEEGRSSSATHLSPDGKLTYQVHVHPVRNDAGAVLAATIVCVDVTELLRQDRDAVAVGREARIGFDSGAIGALRIGLDGRVVDANEAFAELTGRPREEIIGLTSIELTHPGDVASVLEAFGAVVSGRERTWDGEARVVRADGQVAYVLISGVLVDDAAGRPLHVLVQVVDITERKHGEHELARAEADLKRAFDNAPVGMALVDLYGQITRVNRALSDITGHPEPVLMTKRLADLVHPEDAGMDREHVRQLLEGEIREYEIDQRLLNAHGHTIWVSLSASLVRDGDGRPLHFVMQVIDISTRKLVEERLRRLADFDPLTQVHNRRRFAQDLEFQIRRCRRYGEQAALVVLDVDDLKLVNDTYGHRVGDALLKTVAGVLRTRARQADSVARLGGDEFGMLLIHVGPAQAQAVAEELKRLVSTASIALPDGGTLSCSASAGLALLDQGVGADSDVLAEADRAMYADKRARRRA
jgi:diguanylate cyclase (GGDEF)-like protein/PAS domain S-box-containing protein